VHALVSKLKAENIEINPGLAAQAEIRVEVYLRELAKAQLEQACAIFSKRALQARAAAPRASLASSDAERLSSATERHQSSTRRQSERGAPAVQKGTASML
jgi:hypothetical protein